MLATLDKTKLNAIFRFVFRTRRPIPVRRVSMNVREETLDTNHTRSTDTTVVYETLNDERWSSSPENPWNWPGRGKWRMTSSVALYGFISFVLDYPNSLWPSIYVDTFVLFWLQAPTSQLDVSSQFTRHCEQIPCHESHARNFTTQVAFYIHFSFYKLADLRVIVYTCSHTHVARCLSPR